MKFRLYQDLRGEWRWRLVARNGRIVADSAESYTSVSGVERAVEAIAEAVLSGNITIVKD